jgi:hypothetical protein
MTSPGEVRAERERLSERTTLTHHEDRWATIAVMILSHTHAYVAKPMTLIMNG